MPLESKKIARMHNINKGIFSNIRLSIIIISFFMLFLLPVIRWLNTPSYVKVSHSISYIILIRLLSFMIGNLLLIFLFSYGKVIVSLRENFIHMSRILSFDRIKYDEITQCQFLSTTINNKNYYYFLIVQNTKKHIIVLSYKYGKSQIEDFLNKKGVIVS